MTNLDANSRDAWKPFEPTRSRPWTKQAVAHLYRRAGFGASYQQLLEGEKKSPGELVDQLMQGESSRFAEQMALLEKQVLASGSVGRLPNYWLYRMVKTETPLLEKTTLFWHGHFATSADKVDEVGMMLDQNRLLRTNALKKFAPMVQGISKDPAMLTYLDSKENRKTRPNENYARELMELFCLGLGNYTEDDIKQLARTFTGWEIRNDRFRFNKYQHDYGTKRFLGASGEFSGEQAVKIVLSQKSSVEFIATKLVNFFVTDEPFEKEFVRPIAEKLAKTDFDIGSAVRMILSSDVFFQSMGKKIRSPIELGVGLFRNLQATGNFVALSDQLRRLGQVPFFPPNVKGWPGGRTWINSSTLLGRVNTVNDVLRDESTKYEFDSLSGLLNHYGVSEPSDRIRFFEDLFLAQELPKDSRQQLASLLKSRGAADERILNTLHALSAIPEFQLA